MARLEYELASCDSVVHRFSHYTTRTPLKIGTTQKCYLQLWTNLASKDNKKEDYYYSIFDSLGKWDSNGVLRHIDVTKWLQSNNWKYTKKWVRDSFVNSSSFDQPLDDDEKLANILRDHTFKMKHKYLPLVSFGTYNQKQCPRVSSKA